MGRLRHRRAKSALPMKHSFLGSLMGSLSSRRYLHGKALSVMALAIMLSGCAGDKEFPSYPITLICPWAAGGGTDRVSRQLSLFLERELNVPVNVVNATGGGGVTGHSRGLRARPDGYTLTMMTVEINMLHWRGLTEISWKQSMPIMSINQDAAALFVNADSRWNNLDDLMRTIEQQPGQLAASGTATGGIWHLALAGSLKASGLNADDIKWIPMNGAGPSLQELASGGLDMVVCSLPEASTLFRSGRVRCLGVMADERIEGYEIVPTFQEQGIPWSLVGWRGLAVPLGTPPPIVKRLTLAMERIVTGEVKVNEKSFADFMEQEGFDHTWLPPGQFSQQLDELDEKFGTLLTSGAFASVAKAPVGPYVFPTILFAVLVLLLAGLAAKTFFVGHSYRTGAPFSLSGRASLNVSLAIVAVVAYALLVEWTGFLVLATGMFVLLANRFGASLLVSTLAAAVFVPALYQLFVHFLRVPLPRGWLGW